MPVEFGRSSEDLLTAEASKRFLQIISGQLNCYLFVLVVHLKDIKNFLTLSMKSSFPLSMSLYISYQIPLLPLIRETATPFYRHNMGTYNKLTVDLFS